MNAKNLSVSLLLVMITFLVAVAIQMATPKSASAYYVQIDAEKIPVPSFEVVGAVPLTQVGTGVDAQGNSRGNQELHVALSKVIPSSWNFFMSDKVPFCTRINWDTKQDKTWPQTIEKIAKSANIRILIDWNINTLLVLASDEKGSESMFFNPRNGMANADIIQITSDSPFNELHFVQSPQEIKCIQKAANPTCPSQE